MTYILNTKFCYVKQPEKGASANLCSPFVVLSKRSLSGLPESLLHLLGIVCPVLLEESPEVPSVILVRKTVV